MKPKKYFLTFLFIVSLFSLTLSPEYRACGRERLVTPQDYTIDVFYSTKKQAMTQDYEIFIASNGSVTVFNKDYFSSTTSKPKTTVKSGQLSAGELKTLKNTILAMNIFRLNDEYIGSANPLGYRGDQLKVTFNGKTKKILLSASSFPVELGQLLQKIDEIKTEINNS
jgi:hypothetical protein